MASHSLSLAALTVLELPPAAMVEVAAQAGFPLVGLRLIPATEDEPHVSLIDDAGARRRTLAALGATGVGVLDIEILRLRPATRVGDFLPVLELGAELGAGSVLVAGNDDDEARTIDNFAALCDLAAPLGLHPQLEFMPWTGVRDLLQARRIVAAAGRGNAGVLVDAFHFDRSASRLEDLAALPRPWLRYAQLCDAAGPRPADMAEIIRQARQERRFPGDGDLDLAGLLAALPPGIPLSLEVPTRRLWEQGVGALDRARRARQSAEALLRRLGR